jgi:pimeloyl-ACP methyl ester carboxylesterase
MSESSAALPPVQTAVEKVPIGGGRQMVVRVAGTGLPVVLLHGFPLDHTMWAGQWALVAKRGPLAGRARLIAPDLPGFGGSDGPVSVSMAAMADDVLVMLDGLGIHRPAVVCGLSMGGYVAQHLASGHADRLAGLVLVDTKLEADTLEARDARADLSRRVGRVGARIAAEAMVPKLLASDPGAAVDRSPTGRRTIEEGLRRTIESTPVATIQGALAALGARPDMTAAAARFPMPTLLVVGAADAITPPACLERAARSIDDATLEVIPGCGHMTPLEDPAAFNSALVAFLDRRGLTESR